MESINKNMPLISCIIGFSILFFSILHFIGGVRTELKTDMASMETRFNARMDRMETDIKSIETDIKSINDKLSQLLQAQRKPARSPEITQNPSS